MHFAAQKEIAGANLGNVCSGFTHAKTNFQNDWAGGCILSIQSKRFDQVQRLCRIYQKKLSATNFKGFSLPGGSAASTFHKDLDILVEGHTDPVGEESYNLSLSRDRAYAVQSYLGSLGVANSRISSVGYGESMPVASNDSDSGRAQNRRVEVAIYANEKMQRMAKRGELGN